MLPQLPDRSAGAQGCQHCLAERVRLRTLHQLERAELITRRADADDRRANRLRLTDAGAALATRIDARLAELRSELLDGVPVREVEAAFQLLEHVAARIADRSGRP